MSHPRELGPNQTACAPRSLASYKEVGCELPEVHCRTTRDGMLGEMTAQIGVISNHSRQRSPRKQRMSSTTGAYASLRGIGNARRSFFLIIAISSLISGFLQAGLIFLVVRIALVMGEGQRSIALSLAGFNIALSISEALFLSLGMVVATFALSCLNSYASAHLSTGVVHAARTRGLRAYLQANAATQSLEPSSHVQDLLSTYVSRLGLTATIFASGLTALLNFLAFAITAIAVTPLACVLMLAGLIVFGFGVFPLTRLTRSRATQQTRFNSQYSQGVSQAVAASREARVFHVESQLASRLEGLSRQNAQFAVQTRFLASITPVVYQSTAIVLLVAGLGAAYALSVGQVSSLAAVVVLLVRAISYGQQLNSSIQQCSESAPYLDRLNTAFRAFEAARQGWGKRSLRSISDLRLSDVCYSYDGRTPALDRVSVEFSKGRMAGVMGPSGSGKSTLIQILLGLRAPTSGVYSVNGEPLQAHSSEAWYSRVGYVPQETQLIVGTVAENIAFFRDATQGNIESAARMADVHEDILALPHGYDTRIGPGEADLSGGQKQRVSLARALLEEPDLLVLDEPTSALDVHSEAAVQDTLRSLKHHMIVLIVAHRLTTINDCDDVLVLEAGRVSEFGPVNILRHTSDFYSTALKIGNRTA